MMYVMVNEPNLNVWCDHTWFSGYGRIEGYPSLSHVLRTQPKDEFIGPRDMRRPSACGRYRLEVGVATSKSWRHKDSGV